MNNKVLNSGIWFTLGNFFVRSIGLITTPIFTRILSKEDFGNYNNFTTWTGILIVIVSLNLEASLIRARFDFEKDLKNYIYSLYILSLISTCIWYAVVLFFHYFFEILFLMDMKSITCMFVYLLFYPAITLFQTMERFQYKYKWTVGISVSVSITTSFLSVVLVYFFKDKYFGRVIGYIIPIAIIGTIIFCYLLSSHVKLKFAYWKYALPFTLPFVPHLLAMNLLSGMDRVMIKQWCSAEELALYSLAYVCGSVISIFVTSINGAFSPWLGEMLTNKNYKKIKKISFPYVCFFCYIAVGMILFIPELLFFLGGKSYMDAKYVMPPVAASCILQFVYCMYVNIEQFEKKTKGMALASVMSAIVNYILNNIFISKYGYIAAAYTTYVSYFLLMIFHMIIVRKINMSFVYNNKKIMLVACLASLLMFLSASFMNKYLFRYIILTIYILAGLIVMYINRNVLMDIKKHSGDISRTF